VTSDLGAIFSFSQGDDSVDEYRSHADRSNREEIASHQTAVSRRAFLQGAGAAIGGAALSTTSPAAQPRGVFAGFGEFDGLGLAELVRTNMVKPEELLEAAIERVERLNPQLNAVVTKMYDEAREAIRAGLPDDSPFRGVPFMLKETSSPYGGVRFTQASKLFENRIATQDSELVRRYKQAGLVTIGRTNAPEFGCNATTEPRLFGPAKNPWDTTYSTGGSSGGAASVVAARMIPMANGSDGAGSLRIPASCCGVFSMKPSRGRTPAAQHGGELWEGMVAYHAVTLSVRDNAALLDETMGSEIGAPFKIPSPSRPYLDEVTADPRKLKIAWTVKGAADSVHEDCVAALQDAVKLCQDLGHVVIEDSPEIDYAALQDTNTMMWEVHTAAMLDDIEARLGMTITEEHVEPWTLSLAERGRSITAASFVLHREVNQIATQTLGRFFSRYDMLLTPTLGSPPVKLGYFDTLGLPYEVLLRRISEFIPYTWLHNVTGCPAMSVPLYWNAQGLPIGVHFVAAYGEEAILFQLAGQLERARPWRSRVPPVAA
jgi:amidase